jgi:hypothetical protein
VIKNALDNLVPLLPMTVAQLGGVDANGLGAWLLGAMAVMVIVNQALTVWGKLSRGLKEVPPPADTYATRELCDEKHEGIKSRLEKIDQDHQARVDRMERDYQITCRGIHSRINEVLAAVSRLEGKVAK